MTLAAKWATEPGAPQVVSSTLGTQGPALLGTHAIREGGNVARAGTDAQEEGFDFDALLVPGGAGVRREQHNEVLLRWLRDATRRAATRLVFSVCTGSWLLAAAGCLSAQLPCLLVSTANLHRHKSRPSAALYRRRTCKRAAF